MLICLKRFLIWCFWKKQNLLKQSVLISENATPVIGRKFTIGDLKPHTLYELKIKQNYKNQQNGGFTVYNFTTKMTGRSCNKIIISSFFKTIRFKIINTKKYKKLEKLKN